MSKWFPQLEKETPTRQVVNTSNPGRAIKPSSIFPARIHGARSGVVWVVVFALLLPGLFPLIAANPEWALGVPSSDHETHARAAGHHGADDNGEKDYSDIPGSPGHPADHNCNPCQVLKYLASYLPQLPLLLPERAPSALPPLVRCEAQRAGHVALLPPSRAPPQLAV